MKLVSHFFSSRGSRGVGLIEIVIVAAVLGVSVFTSGQFIALGSRLLEVAANRHEAVLYAQEGIEALKSLRNQSWSANIATLTPDTVYYAVAAGTPPQWQFTATDPGPLYGRPQNFRRTIVLGRVYRDGSGNIAPSGTEDTNIRRIVITVNWQERSGRILNIISTTYLANTRGN